MHTSRRFPSALAAAGLVLLTPTAALAGTDPQPDRGKDTRGHQGQPDEHANENATTAPNGQAGDNGGGGAGAVDAESNGNKNDLQTICHGTNSDTNPYVLLTANKNGVVSGHGKEHTGPIWNATLKESNIQWGDIVPPFAYNDHGTTRQFPGQNWTAEGQAWFANGCEQPAAGGGGGETTTGGTTGETSTGGSTGGTTGETTTGGATTGETTTGGGGGGGEATAGGTTGGTTTTTGGFTGGGGGAVLLPGGTTVPAAGTTTAVRGTGAGGGAALPFTGAELGVAAGVAALALGAGTAMVVAGRRRAAAT